MTTNPHDLVKQTVRMNIFHSTYWKECFLLKNDTLVKKAKELDHIGGTHGPNCEPSPFMCLIMKMLQMNLDKGIVVVFIENENYKYVRMLGALYVRLTGKDTDVYQYLEPLLTDRTKLTRKLPDGSFSKVFVDEVILELLTGDYFCDFALPYIEKRLYNANITREVELIDNFKEEKEKKEDGPVLAGLDAANEKDYYARKRDLDRACFFKEYREREYDRLRERGLEEERNAYREKERERVRRLLRMTRTEGDIETEHGYAPEESRKKDSV